MTYGAPVPYAERKALLVARAELDRARVALAVHEIRAFVTLPAEPARRARVRPVAAVLVRVFGPLLGRPRLGRWLRVASLALLAYRLARSWRGLPR